MDDAGQAARASWPAVHAALVEAGWDMSKSERLPQGIPAVRGTPASEGE